ncbi:MAG: hypothetical protein JSS07_09520 [Proteobacteria bacterium]|nr:hypothetical protein [Pseudomonadota bacterium]
MLALSLSVKTALSVLAAVISVAVLAFSIERTSSIATAGCSAIVVVVVASYLPIDAVLSRLILMSSSTILISF